MGVLAEVRDVFLLHPLLKLQCCTTDVLGLIILGAHSLGGTNSTTVQNGDLFPNRPHTVA